MADMDEFCVVRGRKARKARHRSKQTISNSQAENEDEHFDLQNFKKRLDSCIQEILMSQFFLSSYDSTMSAISLLIQEKTASGNKQSTASEGEENTAAGNKDTNDQINDYSCLTCTSAESHRQNLLVPEVTITESLDYSLMNSLELVSLSEDKQQDIHLLSYGIGNFISCLIARYQLAYFLAVRDQLGERCTKCCVYDPVFSSREKLVLEMYNCHVIAENEEGKRACSVPTIAFLPHCGKALYNNLLWRNLTTNNGEDLSRLILIGNSFSNILDRTPKRVLSKTGNYIMKLSPYVTEVHLANTFTHKDVFNDLSIHYFPRSQLVAALQCLGQNLEEPVYEDDDAEFISK